MVESVVWLAIGLVVGFAVLLAVFYITTLRRGRRLGKSRYTACPLRDRWSVFNIYDTMVARTPDPSERRAPASAPPPLR